RRPLHAGEAQARRPDHAPPPARARERRARDPRARRGRARRAGAPRVKGLFLAAVAFLAYGLFCAVLLRRAPRGTALMPRFVAGALVGAAAYVLAFLATSDDLGFLPRAWLEACAPLDLVNGLLVFLIIAATFVNALYATVLAGLSTTVLV